MENSSKPYIGPETVLPEVTVKAVILGFLLSGVLAAANAYLGLLVGMTVSASIPAAVISMAIFKLFRKSNILENNAVQTAASAGESLAAGVIFTFPALVLMNYWTTFNYFETAGIALCGGVLGVLFTIPLRSALIVRQKLTFPEGIATAEVLKTGTEGGGGIKYLGIGFLLGALVKIGDTGFKLFDSIWEKASLLGGKGYAYFGINGSPALLAVGYIIGLRIATLVFAGGVISWWIAIPIYVALTGVTGPDPVALGYEIWNAKIRYLGAGAMLVGGLWALVSIRSALSSALAEARSAFSTTAADISSKPRTEQDTPMSWVLIGIAALVVPIFIIYLREIQNVPISILMALFMVVAGFLFSAVAGYMAGLVGSSNNPISGVTIATVLTSSLVLLALMGGDDPAAGAAAAIMIGAVVCCAAAIAGDNMQDLKAGHLLGATPRKLQIMQMIGVLGAALVLPVVLSLLHGVFGFGPKTEMYPDSLTAPQAGLMQSVAEGVFGGNLPWDFIAIGVVLGIIIILLDQYQERRGSTWRLPVLAVAVGMYLPFELDSGIMLGGILAWLVESYIRKNKTKHSAEAHEAKSSRSEQAGLLFASGLITGEALMGIFLAIPFAIAGNATIFKLVDEGYGGLPGVIFAAVLFVLLYTLAKKAYDQND